MSFLPGFNHDKRTTYNSVRIRNMLLDAINLHEFYTSPLGLTTKRVIGKHIREVWPEVKNMNVLGIGYCPPYLNAFRSEAKRVISVMPVSQGILQQPNKVASQSCLTSEAELPLPDLSMDRVLIIHALEYVESVRPMMREVWRVLSGNGRIIVVTPNRRGIWAQLERTPFGCGQPYSANQLSRLLRDTMFIPISSNGILYVPPSKSRMVMSSALAWESIGRYWFSALGGVISVEASKQIYAGTTLGAASRRKVYSTLPSP